MDAATIERAFEPFFTTKSSSQGTGLGLSIVHEIVEQNGACSSSGSEKPMRGAMPAHGLHFIDVSTDIASALHGSYVPGLVAASIAIAIVMGYAALRVAERIRDTRSQKARALWLALGSVVMGSGIWAMHFVGMLAFVLPLPVDYDVAITLLSLAPAVVASGAGLWFLASGTALTFWRLNGAGLLIASGIGSMHYMGMGAMRIDAEMLYDPALFALSILVAHVLATASLFVTLALAERRAVGRRHTRVLGAIAMGCAVAGMHYTAMAAAVFIPFPEQALHVDAGDSIWLAAAVTLGALMLMTTAVLTTLVDERMEEMAGALVASEANARLIVEMAGEAILAIDASGTILSFNREAAAIFGYAPEEVLGRDVTLLMPLSGVERFREALQRYLSTHELQLFRMRTEDVGLRRDGSEFPVRLLVSELSLENAPAFVGVVVDLSEQKRLETQLLQAKKLESIGQLAAGIAHEINTPAQFVSDNLEFLDQSFAAIAGLLKQHERLMGEAAQGPVSQATLEEVRGAERDADSEFMQDEIPRALAQAREGVSRITTIVRAMKEFSHPGSVEKQPVDLNHAIENTITVARNEWRYVAEVVADFDAGLPMVPCITAELNQVFLNIIVNAAQAIGERARPEKGLIRVRTRFEAPWAVVEISDDGPGMPEAVRSRVFDPFFTTKEVGKGTGQGLAIAHSVVVAKHQGEIEVESELGQGTTFRIRLPLGDVGADGEPA